MRLRELVRGAYGEAAAAELPDVEVAGVAQRADAVGPGYVFVARRGRRLDGHAFAAEAAARGAVLVAGAHPDDPRPAAAGIPYLSVPDDRAAVARLAATFHGHPSRRLRVLGVTGTDGKTTTAALTWWLLQGERPAALMSSAGVRFGEASAPTEGHFTTPEATEVQAQLAEAARHGVDRVVLESSSHGLAWHRLDEVDYDLAVWTNLSEEHLDFHGSLEAYRDAKVSLVRRAGRAVLNRDDPHIEAFAAAASSVVGYGAHAEADWRLRRVEPAAGGLDVAVEHDGRTHALRVPLPGAFNAHNAVAALAAAAAEGVDVDRAVARLASFPGVAGRMQRVAARPFTVVVDFAHTPDALAKALEALRPGARRLIVVVGAAGERDPGKRAPLGFAAVRGADLAVFTEEDARSEPLAAILAEMATGAREGGGVEGASFLRVADRREAIREAIRRAGPGDVVVLCGKGHERTLERVDEILAWDEAEEAARALREAGVSPEA